MSLDFQEEQTYSFGGEKVTSNKGHGREGEHEPKIEMPTKARVLDDEASNYRTDD